VTARPLARVPAWMNGLGKQSNMVAAHFGTTAVGASDNNMAMMTS